MIRIERPISSYRIPENLPLPFEFGGLPDEVDERVREKALNLRSHGMSWVRIARKMNLSAVKVRELCDE